MLASSAASSISCCRRSASLTRRWSCARLPSDSEAKLTVIAMMTMTARISSSVKPRAARGGAARLLNIPVADVGIDTVASGIAVGAERENVDLAVHAGVQVLVG